MSGKYFPNNRSLLSICVLLLGILQTHTQLHAMFIRLRVHSTAKRLNMWWSPGLASHAINPLKGSRNGDERAGRRASLWKKNDSRLLTASPGVIAFVLRCSRRPEERGSRTRPRHSESVAMPLRLTPPFSSRDYEPLPV